MLHSISMIYFLERSNAHNDNYYINCIKKHKKTRIVSYDISIRINIVNTDVYWYEFLHWEMLDLAVTTCVAGNTLV